MWEEVFYSVVVIIDCVEELLVKGKGVGWMVVLVMVLVEWKS